MKTLMIIPISEEWAGEEGFDYQDLLIINDEFSCGNEDADDNTN